MAELSTPNPRATSTAIVGITKMLVLFLNQETGQEPVYSLRDTPSRQTIS